MNPFRQSLDLHTRWDEDEPDQRDVLVLAAQAARQGTISGAAAGHRLLRQTAPVHRLPDFVTVAGAWIDRRKAVVAIFSAEGDRIEEIRSGVDREPSRTDGVRSTISFEAVQVKADDRQQRRFTGQLLPFYEEVVAALSGAQALLLIGPGEAKGELQHHLEASGPQGRIIDVAPAGGMSVRQVVATIRDHFQL